MFFFCFLSILLFHSMSNMWVWPFLKIYFDNINKLIVHVQSKLLDLMVAIKYVHFIYSRLPPV